jgi:hypothetical protein
VTSTGRRAVGGYTTQRQVRQQRKNVQAIPLLAGMIWDAARSHGREEPAPAFPLGTHDDVADNLSMACRRMAKLYEDRPRTSPPRLLHMPLAHNPYTP